MKKKKDDENYLTKLPILGYLFRFVKKNRRPIERTLETEEEVEEPVEKRHFLGGLLTIISSKTFNTLKLKK